ncbi:MAG: hypothetical protein HY897_11780 [Deltaproteobacteria bacterium]|nr:hypothetical protein [Deltaproteobacteria bacterium]
MKALSFGVVGAIAIFLAAGPVACGASETAETGGSDSGVVEDAGGGKTDTGAPDAGATFDGGTVDGSVGFPIISWRASFLAGTTDPGGNLLGGTEARALEAFDGKLFAGIGYWTDKDEGSLSLPGPQVIVLDRPGPEGGQWRQDLQLDEAGPEPYTDWRRYVAISTMKAVTFTTDGNGNELSTPVPLLVAGVWDRFDATEVFVRSATGPESWTRTTIIPQQNPLDPDACRRHVRSFALHRDAVTGVDRVFAGTNGSAPCPRWIYSGVYDASAPGTIRWEADPEPWTDAPGPDDRVTSFAVTGGSLYATVCGKIYVRTDGTVPTWTMIFSHPDDDCPAGPGETGFRGLTPIPGGAAGDKLIMGLEGSTSQIGTLDPTAGNGVDLELDVISFLKDAWSRSWVGYTIVAYNDFAPVTLPSGRLVHLAGLEARIAANTDDPGSWYGWDKGAWFLVRLADGNYELHEIADPTITPKPTLVATRTMIRSPFAGEENVVVYAGGFDCNGVIGVNHETAWIYRGALQP